MTLKKLLLGLVFILIVNFQPLNAQNTLNRIIKSGEIRVGMTLKQPPFCMKSRSGEAIGFDVEIAELLAKSLDFKLRIVEMEFYELMPALESGKIDMIISGMSITPERNLTASFVGPYMISGKSIITKSTALAMADDSEDLNQKDLKIVVMKGTNSEKFTQAILGNATITPVDNYDQGIDLLLNNKADLMLADYPICVLAQVKYPNAGFVSLEEPLTIEPIGIALPANAPQLTNLIQNYLQSLDLAGILDDLEDFWFTNPEWIKDVESVQMKYQGNFLR